MHRAGNRERALIQLFIHQTFIEGLLHAGKILSTREQNRQSLCPHGNFILVCAYAGTDNKQRYQMSIRDKFSECYYKGNAILPYSLLRVGSVICCFSTQLCFILSNKKFSICSSFNKWLIKTLFQALWIRNWFPQTAYHLVRGGWVEHFIENTWKESAAVGFQGNTW